MYKPLDNLSDFRSLKTCSDYILQDCVKGLPVFQDHAEILVRESQLVASSILDAGLNKGLDPPLVFAQVL